MKRMMCLATIAVLFLASCSATNPAAPGTTNYVNITNIYTTTNTGLIVLNFAAPFSTNTNGVMAGNSNNYRWHRVLNANVHGSSLVTWVQYRTNITTVPYMASLNTMSYSWGEGFVDLESSFWMFGTAITNSIYIQN
jgi:hypothetical protein